MITDKQNSELAADLTEQVRQFRQSELAGLSRGKVIGCLGSMIPLELVRACDGRPVRLLEAGDPQDFETAAELMGSDTCPFCRCQIGRRLRGLSPQADVQMLVAANHCDQSRRTSQLFQSHFAVPLLPVFVPATWQDPSSLEMYLSELRWLVAELQDFTGTSPNRDRLAESISTYTTARRTVGRAVDQLTFQPILAHMLLCLLGLADPIRLTDFVSRISPQVHALVEKGHSTDRKPTILIIGSILGDEDISLLAALDGRCCVIQATCSGQMFLDLQIPLPQNADLIDTLGRAYWQQIPSIRSRPNSPLYEYVRSMVNRYQVDAIVYRSLKFCDLWSLEAVRFKHEFNIPVLTLDCNYGPAQAGLIDSRIEALLEMVQENRS